MKESVPRFKWSCTPFSFSINFPDPGDSLWVPNTLVEFSYQLDIIWKRIKITLQLGPVLFHLIKVFVTAGHSYVRWMRFISVQTDWDRRQTGQNCVDIINAKVVTPKLGGSRLFYFDNLTQPIKAIYSNINSVGSRFPSRTASPDYYKGTNRMRRTRKQIECVVENAIITSATREQIECADVAHSRCLPILVM